VLPRFAVLERIAPDPSGSSSSHSSSSSSSAAAAAASASASSSSSSSSSSAAAASPSSSNSYSPWNSVSDALAVSNKKRKANQHAPVSVQVILKGKRHRFYSDQLDRSTVRNVLQFFENIGGPSQRSPTINNLFDLRASAANIEVSDVANRTKNKYKNLIRHLQAHSVLHINDAYLKNTPATHAGIQQLCRQGNHICGGLKCDKR